MRIGVLPPLRLTENKDMQGIFYEAAFLVVILVVLVRGVRLSSRGELSRGSVSLIAASIYLLAMWVPANLQSIGLVNSKLDAEGILPPPKQSEISNLCIHWALELVIILGAEVMTNALINFVRSRRGHEWASSRPLRHSARATTSVLIAIGALSSIAFPAADLSDRADGGQGIQVLLRTFLITGLAMAAYYKFFGEKKYLIAGLIGIAFLVAGNVRSPLLVVLIAYAAGMISRKTLTPRRIFAVVLLAVIFAIGGAFMSNERANIWRNEGYTVTEIAQQTLEDPLSATYEAGIDTLDGYRLSRMINPLVPADPGDLVTVITNFVPRGIWPSKPTDMTVEISAKYLNYGASGQYLSPVGYLRISFGGYTQGLVALFFFCCAFALLVRRFQQSFMLAIVLTVVLRFMLGGSAFDIYYGLTLTVPLIATAILLEIPRQRALRRGIQVLSVPRSAGVWKNAESSNKS